jgi:hypothetical protein
MLSIRSGEGQDILSAVCAHIANQQTQASPPPLNRAMDLVTQQFLVTQMRLIQNPTATISKHSSLAKSVTTSSTTSTGGQA